MREVCGSAVIATSRPRKRIFTNALPIFGSNELNPLIDSGEDKVLEPYGLQQATVLKEASAWKSMISRFIPNL